MIALGTKAPDFTLPTTDGTQVSLADFAGKKALVVIFMCNHCPFVKHIGHKLAQVAQEYLAQDVGFVGISATDVDAYPDDSLENMKKTKADIGYPFPYAYDETQEVAKAYSAACTPDIYVFDANQELVYRGQFDDTRPEKGEATGKDLTNALDSILAGAEVNPDQKPSTGCNIKWKPGSEPEYFK
jgi:peroxiredoxin